MSNPLFFDDIEVGQTWISPARTVTETDVVNFANITGDCDPLHVNHDYAAKSPYRQPIAHGLLGVSWVAGLAIHNPMVRTVAFTSIQKWDFVAPIFFGDTIHVQTTVLEKEHAGKKTGRVHWQKNLINQDGKIVQRGIFETLVSKRTPSMSAPHFDSTKKKSESASSQSGT